LNLLTQRLQDSQAKGDGEAIKIGSKEKSIRSISKSDVKKEGREKAPGTNEFDGNGVLKGIREKNLHVSVF